MHEPTCPWSLMGPSVPSVRWSTPSGTALATALSSFSPPSSIRCTLRVFGGLALVIAVYWLQSM